MKYSVEKKEKYLSLQLQEDKLDSIVAPDLKSEFVKLNAEGIKSIILDMSHVKYVDSSGLSSILVANRLCDNSGGALVLAAVGDHVMKLISISQLDSILNVLPTVEEAVDHIFMNELENDIKSEDGE